MKKIKLLLTFIVLIFISLSASFIISNYQIFKLDKSERDIKSIDLSLVECNNLKCSKNQIMPTDSEEQKVIINYDNYINKLIINYSAKENLSFEIKYMGDDYYDKNISKTVTESFNSKLNKSAVMIKENIGTIELDFKNKDNFYINSIEVDNRITFNGYLFTFILCSLVIICLIYFYYKYQLFNNKIESLFLSVILLIGSLYIILTPCSTSLSWDDQFHYTSIFRIFELDGVTEWTEADSVMTEINPFLSIDTIDEKKAVNDYLNNAREIVKTENNSPFIQYNQVGYLLPGLIMKILSLLKLPFTIKIILTKFSMLLFYSLIIYFAIKIAPRGKMIISLVGLFPISIFLATEFSYDTPIIAGLILFTSLFIRIMEDKKVKINIWYTLGLIISILMACFIKAVYIPFILLLLFIPKEKFNNKKQKNFFKIGIILVFAMMITSFVLPTITDPSSVTDLRGGDTSVSRQINIITSHPIGYLKVLDDTMINQFSQKLIGKETIIDYAYIETDSNYNVYFIILILLIFTVITDSYKKDTYKNEKYIKIFNIILFLGTILLIWTALYLSYTPVGNLSISGVQNRYFIPLIVPFFLISLSNNKIVMINKNKKYESIIMLLISIALLYLIFSTFLVSFCN